MEKLFTLKEICENLELTPRTVRYYEYIELIFQKEMEAKDSIAMKKLGA